ncbi:MAG: outer membrane lipoprotein carrier protein LolA [SAR86 cluster bacterium]|uniref:Outer-membrane lipoprotein carrier protein n=1 Tax=SAR86 cluster bacterium TaxID=2030880 RepID=A0A2A4X0J0_9GAMM|nr:MAG: outer membrane lipoprotein carrier protein LolA [SAR86 cluster bacterium]
MNKFLKQTIVLLAFLCMCTGAVFAQAEANSSAIDRLDALLGNIETLAADVVQLIVESDGGVLEESEIQMLLKKPDGFYWETLTPFPELIVTDGSTLWNYQPDLEQVVIEDWDSSRSELAAQLLSGNIESLAGDYTIDSVTSGESEHQEFELTPRGADNVYQLISINFMHDELESIYLNSKNGQQTVWRFENVIRNRAIADARFQFVPPENIEIIENDYAQ